MRVSTLWPFAHALLLSEHCRTVYSWHAAHNHNPPPSGPSQTTLLLQWHIKQTAALFCIPPPLPVSGSTEDWGQVPVLCVKESISIFCIFYHYVLWSDHQESSICYNLKGLNWTMTAHLDNWKDRIGLVLVLKLRLKVLAYINPVVLYMYVHTHTCIQTYIYLYPCGRCIERAETMSQCLHW